jgi:hypothetical protein
MLTNSALIGHGSKPQDHAELGRPLPPGATLYARGWTGIEERPEPRRWLIGVALRKERAPEDRSPLLSRICAETREPQDLPCVARVVPVSPLKGSRVCLASRL